MLYKKINCESWSEFKELLYKTLYVNNKFVNKKYYFRGQRDSNWEIESSFDRYYKSFFQYMKTNKTDIENEILSTFQMNCKKIYKDLKNFTREEWLALGQHYGLPTRLVDWSLSPYIAAFFAFSGTEYYTYSDNAVSVYAIDTEHNIWNRESGIKLIQELSVENEHQIKQMGVFTYNSSNENTIESYLNYMASKNENIEKCMMKFIIPLHENKNALTDLEAMGITYLSLFSGYDGCAKSSALSTIIKNT